MTAAVPARTGVRLLFHRPAVSTHPWPQGVLRRPVVLPPHLKALVAFDLKIDAFEPEHAGKMDFYLNLLNEKERAPDDQASIGIILCAEKDDIEVEFALKTKANPIGVAQYQLQAKLPVELKGRLPTSKQLADVVREALPPGSRAKKGPTARRLVKGVRK